MPLLLRCKAALLGLLLACGASPAANAQSSLPLRDYGYDRRYERDRTVRGGVDERTLSGRRGLAEDQARRRSDDMDRSRRSGTMDLRTQPFDDRGSPLTTRPSVDGGRSRSFSD